MLNEQVKLPSQVMTDELEEKQQLFFQLASDIENLKKESKNKYAQLEQVMFDLCINTYHQDPITGIVYKIEVPKGTFMEYKTVGYKRTAVAGEKGGTVLSKSEAEENGFVLRK